MPGVARGRLGTPWESGRETGAWLSKRPRVGEIKGADTG